MTPRRWIPSTRLRNLTTSLDFGVYTIGLMNQVDN